MTDKISSAAVVAEIEELRADLAVVTPSIRLMGKPARDMAAKIEKAIADAQDKLADALANELLEAQKKRLANFSDIRVEYDRSETNLLITAFKIIYTRNSYDDRLRDNVPREHTCNGFAALDDDAYEYLITMRPDAIPAPIMALAPDDPHEAFGIYLASKARGYFRTKAAA